MREPRAGELGAPQHPGWLLAAKSTEELERQLAEAQAKLEAAAAVAEQQVDQSVEVAAAKEEGRDAPTADDDSTEALAAQLATARQDITGATAQGDGEAEVKAAMEALETVRRVMEESGQSDEEVSFQWKNPNFLLKDSDLLPEILIFY